jgi:hypothetical protein
MFLRVLFTLVILAIIDKSSTAQQQLPINDDPCSICGKGVSLESYNYTTEVHHLDDNTITDMLVVITLCSKVVQDSRAASFHNNTCSIFQDSLQDALDCTCSNATSEVAPFAPQQAPTALFPPTTPQQLPTAPSTAPLPASTGTGPIIGYYSIAAMLVVGTTAAHSFA